MSAETEKMLHEAATVRNIAVDGELTQKATRYFRAIERQDRETELDGIRRQLGEDVWVQAGLTAAAKARLQKRKRWVEKDLTAHSPPTDLSSETRDALYRRECEVAEQIRQGMPTTEQMRRNPPGAVGMNQRWERAHKDKVLEWKNLRLLNNPDSDDKDLANVDILRSSQLLPDGSSTFMPAAQIPGLFAMTPAAKANWPLGEPTATTAVSHLVTQPVESEAMEPGAFARCLGTPGHPCGTIIKWNHKRCKSCNKLWFSHRIKPFQKEAVKKMTAVKRQKRTAFDAAVERKIMVRIKKEAAPVPDRLGAALDYATRTE